MQIGQRIQQAVNVLTDWADSLLQVENQMVLKEHQGRGVAWFFPTLLALLFSLQNPLLYGMAPAFDASLFATMGKMWADGLVLYQDMVDIKGPIIFLFDAVGYLIGGFQGIWLLETFLLILGLNALSRTLALWGVSPLNRLLGMTAWMLLYAWRYYYGNMTEDYTFSLSLIAQLYFTRMILNGQFSWRHAFIPALTFGFIALMRTNNAAMWCGYYLVIFLAWMIQRHWRDAFLLAFSGVAGLLIVVIPLIGYFSWHGALENFWFYSFGIFFSNSYGNSDNGHSLMVGFMGLVRTGTLIFLPVLIALVWQQYKRKYFQPMGWVILLVSQLAGISFGILANSVSGHTFEHYEILFFSFAILMLPIALQLAREGTVNEQVGSRGLLFSGLVTLLVWAGYILAQHILFTWSRYESPMPKMIHELGISFFASLLLTILLLGCWYLFRARSLVIPAMLAVVILVVGIVLTPVIQGFFKGRPFDDVAEQMVDYIKTHSGYDDSIWVDGVIPQYYVWTDRRPASAYLFFDNVNPPFDVRERMKADLLKNKPKFIIVKLTRMEKVYSGNDRDSTSSFKAYYDYIQQAYEPVSAELPRLYRLKTD